MTREFTRRRKDAALFEDRIDMGRDKWFSHIAKKAGSEGVENPSEDEDSIRG